MLPSLLQRPPAPQPFKSPLGNSFLRPCPLLQPPATPRLQALQAKPTKAVDFRGLSDDEIDQEVDKCQRELFRLRFVQARREAFKPHEFRWQRKKIAQLLTVKRQREIEQGIGSRESRRLQKAKNVAAGFPQF